MITKARTIIAGVMGLAGFIHDIINNPVTQEILISRIIRDYVIQARIRTEGWPCSHVASITTSGSCRACNVRFVPQFWGWEMIEYIHIASDGRHVKRFVDPDWAESRGYVVDPQRDFLDKLRQQKQAQEEYPAEREPGFGRTS